MIQQIKKAFGIRPDNYELRIEMAENIISCFETMLNVEHLSERKDVATVWARGQIRHYRQLFPKN